MRKRTLRSAAGVTLAAGVAALGYAQSEPRAGDRDDVADLYDDARADVVPLSEWRYDELYEGWSADGLLGMPVQGPNGDYIGEAKNLLIDERGAIVALIAEIRALGELGDTHVAIPWSEVERGADAVRVPVTGDTVEDYGLFDEALYSRLDAGDVDAVAEDVRTGPYTWKATELLDDYVVIEPGEPYGYVSDLVFDDAGNLESVVANASNAKLGFSGDYAYPWYGYDHGWRPGLSAYNVPYTREQIAGLSVFDYDEFEDESGP